MEKQQTAPAHRPLSAPDRPATWRLASVRTFRACAARFRVAAVSVARQTMSHRAPPPNRVGEGLVGCGGPPPTEEEGVPTRG